MNKLYEYLRSVNVTPNELYFMHCIVNSIIPGMIDIEEIKRSLLVKDYLTGDYKISKKAKEVLQKANAIFKANEELKEKKKRIKLSEAQIREYLYIFPDIMLPSGKKARQDIKTIEKALTWFLMNYNYDWSTIIKATTKYVEDYEVKRYHYMRTSQYFIKKSDNTRTISSELASYCESVINNTGLDTQKSYFKDKVV